tara:strand:- start:3361 stop:3561 length:201 start_codon:yes stop_codon:yes gene_type:complete
MRHKISDGILLIPKGPGNSAAYDSFSILGIPWVSLRPLNPNLSIKRAKSPKFFSFWWTVGLVLTAF